MITELQGLPPIIIQNFPELKNDIKEELKNGLTENEKNKIIETTKTAVSEEKQKLSDFSDLSEMAQNLLDENNVIVEFSMDKETKKMIMRMINAETKEVIQQYPPAISLKIARIVANAIDKGAVTNAKF